MKIIPADRLERARCKKFGVPYDPVGDAQIKAFVRWKVMNHRLMEARDRLMPRGRK